jgi:hypothetical protein
MIYNVLQNTAAAAALIPILWFIAKRNEILEKKNKAEGNGSKNVTINQLSEA